MEPSLFTRPD